MKSESLETIAAELIGRPVYVALQSQGVPENIGGKHIGGCYGRRLDLSLKSWLQAEGRWHGRRPAIYIDDVREELFGCVLIHELAHVADVGFSDSPFVFETTLQAEATLWAETRDNPPVIDRAVGYDTVHGPQFVRACCHLWHRSRALGCFYSPTEIYNGKIYNVPEAWPAMDALGDEPQRLEELPIELFLNLPAPERFNNLFERPKS